MLATLAFILIFVTLVSGVWDRRRVTLLAFLVSWVLIAVLFAVESSVPPVVQP